MTITRKGDGAPSLAPVTPKVPGTIIEGAVGAEERHRDAEQPETAGSETPTSESGTPAPEEAPSMVAIEPQPVSMAALHGITRRHGPLISGPPVPKSLADIWAGGGNGAAGYTDWPSGIKVPDFDFNATQSGSAWNASPTLKTAAHEGTSGSFYTSAGSHKTGTQEGGKDVYYRFSPAISNLVKAGEQEHCNDFAEAYKISLKEAETIIKTNLVGKTFGPKPTKAEAEKLVLDEITKNLTHAGLGNDKTKWAGIYGTLYQKTLKRDTSGWHSVTLGARTTNPAGDVIYDVVAGTSQIGRHASNTVIKY